MAITAKAVVRIIIEGEWIWVERGTFTVVPFQFETEDGEVLGNENEAAYFFISTNGDPYFGPLSAVSLMKLDTQLLEESDAAVVRSLELGPATAADIETGEEFKADFEEPGDDRDKPARKPIALFAGDAEPGDDQDTDGGEPEGRRGGLF